MHNGPRILCYSHDTYGLGHLRRNLLLAEHFSNACPKRPSILIATGSTRAGSFPMPPGTDTLKLPCITKRTDGSYAPRSLEGSLEEVLALRGRLLLAAVNAFQPHFLFVDHVPAGLLGELRETLHHVAGMPQRPFLCLGLRDIIDEKQRVLSEWQRDGVNEVLPLYDRIFVYGDGQLGSSGKELGLEERFPGKVIHTGYLARPRAVARADAFVPYQPRGTEMPRFPLGQAPVVLVTTGGGGDGHEVLRHYASFLESHTKPLPFHSLVVGGPLLSHRRTDELRLRFASMTHSVVFTDFVEDMDVRIANAAAVVCMAGYNTVSEVLAAGTPALLVPRDGPRLEQIQRANLMAARGSCRTARLAELSPQLLDAFLGDALSGHWKPSAPPNLAGRERVCAEMAALMEGAFSKTPAPVGGA